MIFLAFYPEKKIHIMAYREDKPWLEIELAFLLDFIDACISIVVCTGVNKQVRD